MTYFGRKGREVGGKALGILLIVLPLQPSRHAQIIYKRIVLPSSYGVFYVCIQRIVSRIAISSSTQTQIYKLLVEFLTIDFKLSLKSVLRMPNVITSVFASVFKGFEKTFNFFRRLRRPAKPSILNLKKKIAAFGGENLKM